MTFTEAAEAVLRKAGKPLHFKKITQFAIEQNLLSHVGKTPETTMSTRLATLTKKDRGDQNLVRVKPGVFGLREWGAEASTDAADDSAEETTEEATEEAAPAVVAAPVERPSPRLPPSPPPAPAAAAAPEGRGRREGRGRDGRGRGEGRAEGAVEGRGEARPEGRGEARPEGRGEGRGEGRRGEARPPAAPQVAPAPVASEAAAVPAGEGRRRDRDRDRGRGRDRGRDRPAVGTATAEGVAPVAAVTIAPALDDDGRMPQLGSVEPAYVAEAEVPTKAPSVPPTEAASTIETAEVNAVDEVSHLEAAEELAPGEVVVAAAVPAPVPVPSRRPPATPAELAEMSPDERDRSQRFAAAQEMFPEEDDDEEPLLGGDDKTDGNRRRRRRRRRRPDGTPEGPEGVEAAPGEVRVERVEPRADVRHEPRHEPRADNRGDRGEARPDRGDRDRGDRDNRGDRGERREERDRSEGSEELGRDTADIVVSLLTRREDRQPAAIRHLVDDAVRAGKLSGDATVLAASVAAAVRIDGVRRTARGERPRMRLAGGRVGLVDWTLPPELLRAEAEAVAAIERLREQSRRYVVRRLNELPPSSFVEVAALLLERLGMSNLRVSRRPGLPQGEVHLSGVARRGPEELPVAVVLKRGGEVGRERVIEMRGSLHHYGNAQAVWILTTGNIFSGARDEAAAQGAVPVTLVDGAGLGRLLDEHAVLVQHATITLPTLDVDLYDALRSV